jgi:hypothetical protein
VLLLVQQMQFQLQLQTFHTQERLLVLLVAEQESLLMQLVRHLVVQLEHLVVEYQLLVVLGLLLQQAHKLAALVQEELFVAVVEQ